MALDKSLDTAATGLDVGTKKLEGIAHNIVNLTSVAFKGTKMYQTDAFYETLQQSAANPSTAATAGSGSNTAAAQIGNGTRVGAIIRDFSQGPLEPSRTPSHLAIDGKGWFQVLNSINGDKFATRDGSFRTDTEGYFVTKQGYRLQGTVFDPLAEPTYTVTYVNNELIYTQDTPSTPGAPSIGSLSIKYELSVGDGLSVDSSVPSSITTAQIEAAAPRVQNYNMNDKGQLTLQLSNGDSFVRGQALLMSFKDEQGLLAQSGGLYGGFAGAGLETFSESASQPGTGGLGKVSQNRLEGSNVDLTGEFTELIGAQRFTQACSRSFSTSNKNLEEIVNLIR